MPLLVRPERKTDMRTQFAALCYRIKADRPEVLLITSRGTGRWIVPKGWPVPGMTPAASAEREAWEEAGVRGRFHDICLGLYSYIKIVEDGPDLPCAAMVYPVRVRALAEDYPEKDQRKRKWMRRKKAAAKVDEPELAQIIRRFDPKLLRS